MKLIYIANVRLPTEKAHGIQIMKMCEAFSNQGLKVELIVPWRFNKIKQDPFYFYGIKRNFKVKRIPSLDLVPLNIPKYCFRIQGLSFALLALFYLLFKKVDIIYSRDPYSLFFLSFFKKNLVYEVHAFYKSFYPFRRAIKKTKAIIVITHKLKELLIGIKVSADKILVASDGIDLDKFNIEITKGEARKKLDLPLDKKMVVYSGHLYPWKGADILAEAVKLMGNDVLAVFIGGTERDLEEFKKKHRDNNSILVIGHRPYQEIPYYLKAADALVLPNSGKTEISKDWTSPMKMFEYMASQRPIIASDLPSLREILNESNAILVKSDSPQDLAEGIGRALKNPDFSARISSKALKKAQKYSWSNRVDNILSFIETL